MARNPTAAQLAAIKAALDQFPERVKAAFADAIFSARAAVDVAALVDALERGDAAGAVAQIELTESQLWRMAEEVRGVYLWSGDAQISAVAPAGFGGASWRFDGSNPIAQDWIATRGADLAQGIVADTKAATQRAILDVLESPMDRSLRAAALDIVGRTNKTTGRREGGILGLTAEQTDYAISARAELTRLDPHYFTRARRDKRYDAIVRKAIESGKALTQAEIDRITGRYKDRLLSYRGDLISQHETFAAQAAAREEAMRQTLLRNDVEAITKRWQLGFPKEHRANHVALKDTVVDFSERFDLGNGVTAACPHDAELPVGETAWCRCSCVYRVKLRKD